MTVMKSDLVTDGDSGTGSGSFIETRSGVKFPRKRNATEAGLDDDDDSDDAIVDAASTVSAGGVDSTTATATMMDHPTIIPITTPIQRKIYGDDYMEPKRLRLTNLNHNVIEDTPLISSEIIECSVQPAEQSTFIVPTPTQRDYKSILINLQCVPTPCENCLSVKCFCSLL